MKPDIRTILDNIAIETTKLNALCDRTSEETREIEQELDKIGVGVRTEIGTDFGWLRYTRYKGKFRIIARWKEDDTEEFTPVVELSRQRKIECTNWVPILLKAICHNVTEALKKLQGTK